MKQKKTAHSPAVEDPNKPGQIFGINRLVHTKPLPDTSNLAYFYANRGQERPLKIGVKLQAYAAKVAKYMADGYTVRERD